MNVLVTGANGQLGNCLKNFKKDFPKIDFVFTDVDELDITNEKELEAFFNKQEYDYLVNCAAYTSVDKAEEDKENAKLLNVHAVKLLAGFSKKFNFKIIHISTDYVFGGKHFRPYTEESIPEPESVYASTKYDAEKILAQISNNSIILRTSWLYSEFGNNFLKTIIKLASNRDELKIIADQIGTPTYAGDLASAIMTVITNYPKNKRTEVYHFSNQGIASWFDFAFEIVSQTKIDCKVLPIKTEEYPLPAKRPFYSVMDKSKFTDTFNVDIPYWKQSLKTCISNLK